MPGPEFKNLTDFAVAVYKEKEMGVDDPRLEILYAEAGIADKKEEERIQLEDFGDILFGE